MSHSSVQSAIAREDEALSGRGRVLVRASGTEALIRVMVEAPSAEETEQVCARLTEVVRDAMGPGKGGA
jgi:phosphoglucosamine mutase